MYDTDTKKKNIKVKEKRKGRTTQIPGIRPFTANGVVSYVPLMTLFLYFRY